jgi:hypothetical protein
MRFFSIVMLCCLSLVGADKPVGPILAHDHDHRGVTAGDADCPAYSNGLKCYGFGIMDGLPSTAPSIAARAAAPVGS